MTYVALDWREEAFSYIRLGVFRQCPKKFRYRYIEKRAGAFDTVEGFVGRVVHKSLAWLYDTARKSLGIRREDLLDYFAEAWSSQYSALQVPLKVVKQGEGLSQHRARGASMLGRYFEDRYRRDSSETLEIERRFELRLAGKHRFKGIVDRLAKDSKGQIYVVDFKTSKQGSREPDADGGLQLDVYGVWALL